LPADGEAKKRPCRLAAASCLSRQQTADSGTINAKKKFFCESFLAKNLVSWGNGCTFAVAFEKQMAG